MLRDSPPEFSQQVVPRMQLTAIPVPLAHAPTAEATSRAFEIAAVGMLMVFLALALLTIFLTLLPRVLRLVARVWPETAEHSSGHGAAEEILSDEDEVLAAIAFVLHAEGRELP